MAGIKETDGQELVKAAALQLKGLEGMGMPEWARFIKTGVSRERPPQQEDWWWMRGASILRKVYLGGSGVSRLRRTYSGRRNLGHSPERRAPSSGKVIRVLLGQLETEGLVKKSKGKGRTITPKGQQFLENAAKGLK